MGEGERGTGRGGKEKQHLTNHIHACIHVLVQRITTSVYDSELPQKSLDFFLNVSPIAASLLMIAINTSSLQHLEIQRANNIFFFCKDVLKKNRIQEREGGNPRLGVLKSF